jgi:dihydroorotate dehydrogenase (NAD+) catalytic subunit
MGGIATGRDALDFLAAGASSIALGTVLFTDPEAPGRVRRELADQLAARGLSEGRRRGPASRTARNLPLLPDRTIAEFCGQNTLFARVLRAH